MPFYDILSQKNIASYTLRNLFPSLFCIPNHGSIRSQNHFPATHVFLVFTTREPYKIPAAPSPYKASDL